MTPLARRRAVPPAPAPMPLGRPLRAVVAVWLVLAGVGWLVRESGLRFVLSSSLPLGVYRTVAGPPVRGAIVMACLPAPVARFAVARGYLWRGACAAGAAPLAKLVLGLPGDSITLSATGVALNGHPVRATRPLSRDADGRLLDHYPYGTHVLRTGELWLFSPYHPRSFDSRYFGPVPSVAVRSRLVPLWTLGVSERVYCAG